MRMNLCEGCGSKSVVFVFGANHSSMSLKSVLQVRKQFPADACPDLQLIVSNWICESG